ncbi:MAG: hypothetical protein KDJ88_13270 [Bauldia sp.]|nr:hypothetical protein [Bauldia sp.]
MYRVIIVACLAFVVVSVGMRIKWQNAGALLGLVIDTQASRFTAPGPVGETTEQRRERLKDEMLVAGRKLLAEPCSTDAAADYREALISLSRQRMRDMGCATDLCNLEKNDLRGISFKYYATPKDSRISIQLKEITEGDAKTYLGDLGLHRLLVGHPKQMVPERLWSFSPPACEG